MHWLEKQGDKSSYGLWVDLSLPSITNVLNPLPSIELNQVTDVPQESHLMWISKPRFF